MTDTNTVIPRMNSLERRARIWEAFQSGVSLDTLSREHGVSRQRIYQILEQEAAHRGETLRKRRYRRCRTIPAGLAAAVEAGEMTSTMAASLMGVSAVYFRILCARKGVHCNHQRNRRDHVLARDAEMYQRFMAGAKLRELAAEHGVSKGVIAQRLNRHRKRTGAPVKVGWQGKHWQERRSAS